VIVAHVVAPGGAPLYATWLAAAALFGGGVGAVVLWRQPPRRGLMLTISAAGFAATATLLIAPQPAPLRPGYSIRLVKPGATTSPVVLRVCEVNAVVSPAPVPGAGRLVLVSVDGHQVAEVRSNTVAVPMPAGAHHVVAELITADHRAFVPPITADMTLTVTGPGPIGPAPTCAP